MLTEKRENENMGKYWGTLDVYITSWIYLTTGIYPELKYFYVKVFSHPFLTIVLWEQIMVIEKIGLLVTTVYLILIVRFIKFVVELREKWHKGSLVKHKAKRARLEACYLEHKIKEKNYRKKSTYC